MTDNIESKMATAELAEGAPGQRFTRKGQAARNRIIEVAATLMFDNGVAETSLEQIQRAADVSGSQLTHYFGNKLNLLRAVIAYQTDATLDLQRPILDRLDSFEALEAWRDAAVAHQDAINCIGGCGIGSLAAELATSRPDVRPDLIASFERWEAPIRNGLAAMRDRRELRADTDPRFLATALLAAVQGGLLLTQVRQDSEPLYTALTALIDYVRSFASTSTGTTVPTP